MKSVSEQTAGQLKILLSIILFATITRISLPPVLGHPPNFSALDAIALFSGAYFVRRGFACLVVLFSVWVGDILLSKMMLGSWSLFYPGWYWQYASYILITFLGMALRQNLTLGRLAAASLLASTLFFTISNLGVWYQSLWYAKTIEGLMACYVAAIPFFKNTLLSDLFFTGILFGSFELIQLRINKIKPVSL